MAWLLISSTRVYFYGMSGLKDSIPGSAGSGTLHDLIGQLNRLTPSSNYPSVWATVPSDSSTPLPMLRALMSAPRPEPAGIGSFLRGLTATAHQSSLAIPAPTSTPTMGLGSPLLRALAAAPLVSRPPLATPAPTIQWAYVIRRFNAILDYLNLTDSQLQDGNTKQAGVVECLNRHYWSLESKTANSQLIGSWGKTTQVWPPQDIDLLFILPSNVYWDFQRRSGNKQSQLLQDVRSVLADVGRYRNTEMRGDGQVVIVKFDSIWVEVVPAFRCSDGELIVCDTANGGRYKLTDPGAELATLDGSDARWHGNTRALTRMLKRWQDYRSVAGLKSFHFERLAIDFLASWPHADQDRFYYDWMMRDFFRYLLACVNKTFRMPGTGEIICFGSDWVGEAVRAFKYTTAACVYERENCEMQAGESWQQIFGAASPVRVA